MQLHGSLVSISCKLRKAVAGVRFERLKKMGVREKLVTNARGTEGVQITSSRSVKPSG